MSAGSAIRSTDPSRAVGDAAQLADVPVGADTTAVALELAGDRLHRRGELLGGLAPRSFRR